MKIEKHFDSEQNPPQETCSSSCCHISCIVTLQPQPRFEAWGSALDKTAQKEKSRDNPFCRAIC